MKRIKRHIRVIGKLVLVTFSFALIFILHSCDCIGTSESLDLLVFAGDRSSECEKLVRENSYGHPEITYICKGEKVTICWKSNAIPQLKLTIGTNSQSVGASGSQVVTITETTDIILAPSGGKCVTSSRKFTVKVIDSPTPISWNAGYDLRCSKITFKISDAFMSSTIKVKDIRAPWDPFVYYTDAAGNTIPTVCTTPPFLTGEQHQEAFGFDITKPYVSVTFGRPLSAVGDWNFLVKAVCPSGQYICNNGAVFPFDLTLICP